VIIESMVSENVVFVGRHYIGPHCIVGFPGYQHPHWSAGDFSRSQLRQTVLGDNFRMVGLSVVCEGSHIGSDFRADSHSYIGEDCRIGDRVVIEYGARIYDRVRIGSNVTIGGFVCNEAVLADDCVVQGSLIHARTSPPPEPAPQIGAGAFIGSGAIVIGGIEIAPRTFVAAGAVVTADTESGYLYAGVPARRIRQASWI
jgi:acetyltransferase-like isoleucine patch superfamily enzyme